MIVKQVKEYHRMIADGRYQGSDKSKSVKSMFYFMVEDRQGYPTTERKNGYVACNDVSACYGRTEAEAIAKLNK